VVVGTAFGFFVPDLNTIVLWIVGALYGGYTASNLLKWYWWRFNSYGYFWGMAAGIAAAGIVPAAMTLLFGEGAFGEAKPVYGFPIILVLSLIGCIAGSLMTKPDDEVVLKEFYLKTRPWGFWKPIHEKVLQQHPELAANGDLKRDMFNVVVGIVWQTALTATGIVLVIEEWRYLLLCVAVIAVTSVILKYNWYDRMEDFPKDLERTAL